MNDSIEKKLMDLTKIKTTQKVIILTLIILLNKILNARLT